jgi:hypothetical protein
VCVCVCVGARTRARFELASEEGCRKFYHDLKPEEKKTGKVVRSVIVSGSPVRGFEPLSALPCDMWVCFAMLQALLRQCRAPWMLGYCLKSCSLCPKTCIDVIPQDGRLDCGQWVCPSALVPGSGCNIPSFLSFPQIPLLATFSHSTFTFPLPNSPFPFLTPVLKIPFWSFKSGKIAKNFSTPTELHPSSL